MNNKFLIVAAHPDDEVLGCFATAAKLIKQGFMGYTLILSNGKTSRDDANNEDIRVLKNEMYLANKTIGIKEIFQADFPDNAFDSVPLLNIVKKIEETKEHVRPSIIFTHHYGDMNIDHSITHRAVLTSTRPMQNEYVKTIYAMEIPSSTEWNSYSKENIFTPNIFVDVTSTIDFKVKAMEKYKSELRNYPHPRSLKYIKEIAKVNGIKVGLDYSENFMLIRSIL